MIGALPVSGVPFFLESGSLVIRAFFVFWVDTIGTMNTLAPMLSSLWNLLLVVVGFGLVVFIHEMGHFLTARWAGIRVHAFALGFGPALMSYRKGWGITTGSSEPRYNRLLEQAHSRDPAERAQARKQLDTLSPTEYRFNALPFGGYVKMLGQNDIAPESDEAMERLKVEPDSYLAKPIWKRMIVISGGVAMNLISAALVFMLVFFVGLETEPARVGRVYSGEPAALAVATNAPALGVTTPGLHSGDEVVRVNGKAPDDFNDLVMAVAMTPPDGTVDLAIKRPGVDGVLDFSITPRRDPVTRLYEIGIEPVRTTKIMSVRRPSELQKWHEIAGKLGIDGVEPGMVLVRAGAIESPRTAAALVEAAAASGGHPFEALFADEQGRKVTVELTPVAQLMVDDADPEARTITPVSHVLGMMPVMKVGDLASTDRGYAQGLRQGDLFVRIGGIEYPSVAQGVREIRRHAGKPLTIVVERGGSVDDAPGTGTERVELEVLVRNDGTIGFGLDTTVQESTLLAMPPAALWRLDETGASYQPAAAGCIDGPGRRVLRVGDEPVHTFGHMRDAIQSLVRIAWSGQPEAMREPVTVPMTLALPYAPQPDSSPLTERVFLTISPEEGARLLALSYDSPLSPGMFEPEEVLLKASGPIQAVGMGIRRTRNMMVMTYLTLARLVQGTVQVENLKGPVGIAQLGTQVAARGLVWLLFFLGLISVNLAVVNFLPLPIADGGQFLMLLYEQIRGRPLPVSIQNGLTMAGLVLFVSLFLVITYNDIARLFGS